MPVLYPLAVEALRAEQARVEALSSNLVNSVTTGYKRSVPVVSFSDSLSALVQNARATVRPGTTPTVATDFAAGVLTETGDKNHFALIGPGFFEVRDADQTLFTRAGAFRRDDRGRLVTGAGLALQGDRGDIVLQSDRFEVQRDGTVVDGDRAIGRIRVVDFADRALLQRVGGASFLAKAQVAHDIKTPTLRQGFLEASNVSTSTEMVQLMEAVKRFEFGQRVFQTQDDMLDRSIRRIGESQ